VLANDLSIESGDQTANLKLRRQAIARRLEDVLEDLYAGVSPSEAVTILGKQ
jgi:long-chain acyl-CoA synthetase